MTATRDKERKDKRVFVTSFDEIEITEKALAVIRSKTSVKVKTVLDKVGILPEEARSRIESDLDEAQS